MTDRFYSSTAQPTTLALNVTAGTTAIEVVSLVGYPASFPYTLCLDFDTGLRELVDVTAASGTTLTVTRGVDGTSAVAHSAGAVVRHVSSARDYADSRAHENATSGVHGATGDVVGTTDAQILSNKIISAGNATGGFTVAGGLNADALVVTNNVTAGGLLSAANFTNPTTFAPIWQADSGTAPSIGNGSISMEYIIMGNTLFYWLSFRAGTTTTFGSGGNWVFQLPPVGTYSFNHSGGGGWARPNNSDSTSVPIAAVPGSFSPSGAGIRPLTIGGQVDGNAVPGTGFVDSASPSTWTTAGQFFLQGFIKFTP